VGNRNDAAQAAELWRFTPKAFKGYQNIPDPVEIQRRAEAQIPIKQVIEGWAIGTDPAVHIQAIETLFKSGVTIVNIHSGQPEQRRVNRLLWRERIAARELRRRRDGLTRRRPRAYGRRPARFLLTLVGQLAFG